ncbi:dienelactone hydrolase [Myxosarcina sp. GI1]|uniref:alpha/beta hydrolase family protein n=1 Tax=Myxosarcina sp. GI1 TaxID=1541065 RepID=UPI0005666A84|nr:dienelactone hydrolase [Myxosarcina sp. GI1]
MSVRALYRAAKVANAPSPYDTIHLKVFYPARLSGKESQQNFGIVPANKDRSPFKIVIFFNGVNCGAERYQWLAVKLAERGLVVVTFNWIAENLPGRIAITPGVEVKAWTPDVYGTIPSASALPTLLQVLEDLQSEGVLAGLLDLERIVLGGHSAGGRIAMENTNPQFFPQVVAAFAYGAHTAAAVQAGYVPGTILPLPDSLPLMLMGGTNDGVIAQSSNIYGVTWERATTPIERTFNEAIAGGRNDSYLLLLKEANHFAITHPFDANTGTTFLDFPTARSQEDIRNLMAETIGLFIDAHVRSQTQAITALNQLLKSSHPAIARIERK